MIGCSWSAFRTLTVTARLRLWGLSDVKIDEYTGTYNVWPATARNPPLGASISVPPSRGLVTAGAALSPCPHDVSSVRTAMVKTVPRGCLIDPPDSPGARLPWSARPVLRVLYLDPDTPGIARCGSGPARGRSGRASRAVGGGRTPSSPTRPRPHPRTRCPRPPGAAP